LPELLDVGFLPVFWVPLGFKGIWPSLLIWEEVGGMKVMDEEEGGPFACDFVNEGNKRALLQPRLPPF
jgi:hypothetical protein